MRPQEDPDKATRLLQRAQKEKFCGRMIKEMEDLYDFLDSGKSFEEMEILIDILGAASPTLEPLTEWRHDALNIIKSAREQQADRNEVMIFWRNKIKALCDVTERDC
jgi:hypothetical protein